MAFEISKSFGIMEQALHYRKIRQDMIASNIANADTPFYRPKDIRFEDALQEEINKKFNKPSKKLELAKTNPMHLEPKDIEDSYKPIVFFRDGHLARNDGNSVDIDVETTEMAKNNIAYNATIQALKKDIEIFKAVIDSSKNI
ncbi:flagellar basal body rod protein FlgB [Caminibacter mediatlanticus TB-2]|uniref:Flagellar basal body rod protein FlgB n=1 Tax=Caminibacter mediatlanticus TB-2 TaxID=391592 RepID=A0AAI9AGI4_9BACT|nr:flagellar basal body rod protein FlgB [Caminibacter mediatlanticus]EDM23217.1 flagellar basal-body rod protein B [Caminibacter mediatlanticus TB-2]QCT93903.1 flagellar basal body rod protein FlgB [Caminibacter mediatlanticus TB-2]